MRKYFLYFPNKIEKTKYIRNDIDLPEKSPFAWL